MKSIKFSISSSFLTIVITFSSCGLFDELDDEINLRHYEDYVKEQDKYPAWSPDGEHIAYYHYSSQLPEPEDYPSGLYIINKSGANRQLVLEGVNLESPSWSPDGDSLVFSNGGLIQKCRIDGSGLTTFAGLDGQPDSFEDALFFPDWSPDGKYILFDRAATVEGESSLYWMYSDFTNVNPIFNQVITSGRAHLDCHNLR